MGMVPQLSALMHILDYFELPRLVAEQIEKSILSRLESTSSFGAGYSTQCMLAQLSSAHFARSCWFSFISMKHVSKCHFGIEYGKKNQHGRFEETAGSF